MFYRMLVWLNFYLLLLFTGIVGQKVKKVRIVKFRSAAADPTPANPTRGPPETLRVPIAEASPFKGLTAYASIRSQIAAFLHDITICTSWHYTIYIQNFTLKYFM